MGLGAAGAVGAPGAFGALGIDGIPGAGVAFAPQLGHSSALESTSAPHLGHFTGPTPTTDGLKHIIHFLLSLPLYFLASNILTKTAWVNICLDS